jgi:glyoxylase-like metal-dependent hydrolase (beta-lactamase superfamily II)
MNEIYESLEVVPKVWQINDKPGNVTMYLLEGEDKAILIDAGDSKGDLQRYIKTLTVKPVELIVTHGHGDHAARIDQFDKVYLSHVDIDMLTDWFDMKIDASNVIDLKGDENFNIGGKTIEVISVPGHTLGSVAILDRERELLFTSDCIGSGGLWMQLPTSTTLTKYYATLCDLQKKLEGMSNLQIFVGHAGKLGNRYYLDYLNDLHELTKDIIDGNVTGKATEDPNGFFGGYEASRGKMKGLIYKLNKIR